MISLMEILLVSISAKWAMNSKCMEALYGGGVSVDGHALDFVFKAVLSFISAATKWVVLTLELKLHASFVTTGSLACQFNINP